MAARRPFCKWHRWKSIGFYLWPPSTCIWDLKLKFQSKLDLCSGNHVVYRQTDRRTDGRTDGQGESSIPPLQLRWAGYNKAPVLCFFKLCASFHSHWWIQTGVKSPETPNLGQMLRFLEPCDLEIWQMTLKNNRTPLLCYFKLCASFHSHFIIICEFKLELQSGNG